MRLSDMDNPVWNALGKLTDLVILTLLWLVSSAPVVTAGAATAALYDVAFQMAENREGYIVRSFFGSLRKNWKRGTAVWLFTVVLGILLASDFYVYSHMEQRIRTVFLTAGVLLALIYLMTLLYAFPLLARREAAPGIVLAEAFVLAVRNMGWTFFMLTIAASIVALGIFVLAPVLLIGAGLTAYIQVKILRMIPDFGKGMGEKDVISENE